MIERTKQQIEFAVRCSVRKGRSKPFVLQSIQRCFGFSDKVERTASEEFDRYTNEKSPERIGA